MTMNCPKCGNTKAEALFTSVECPNEACELFSSSLYRKLANEVTEELDNERQAYDGFPFFWYHPAADH